MLIQNSLYLLWNNWTPVVLVIMGNLLELLWSVEDINELLLSMGEFADLFPIVHVGKIILHLVITTFGLNL